MTRALEFKKAKQRLKNIGIVFPQPSVMTPSQKVRPKYDRIIFIFVENGQNEILDCSMYFLRWLSYGQDKTLL